MEQLLDNRYIISYEVRKGPDGKSMDVPVERKVEGIGGLKTIQAALWKRVAENDFDPLVVVGDLSGLGDFNNHYGRGVADGAIEAALNAFAKSMDEHGEAPFSLSGDEMGVLIKKDVDTKVAVETLENTLRSFNTMDYDTGKEKVGLNAKFFIGRRSLKTIEKHLKYHPETGEKLPPGTIVVGKELLGSKMDRVIYPEGVSNEKVVMGRAGGRSHEGSGGYEKERGGSRQRGGGETAEDKKKRERIEKLKIAIELQKEFFGEIGTQHPFIVELKRLQGRGLTPKEVGAGVTRRAAEQAPRAEIHNKTERLIIHNENILWKSKELEAVHELYKSKMRQASTLLADSVMDIKKKHIVVDYLNGKESGDIWKKRSLSPEAILAAGCMKTGVPDSVFSDQLNDSEAKLVRKIVKTDAKSKGMSL